MASQIAPPPYLPAPDHVWVRVTTAPGGWASYDGPDPVAFARRVWGDDAVTGETHDPRA